ncbi:MAG: sulfatase family protein [Solirubrobacterales bacterium]
MALAALGAGLVDSARPASGAGAAGAAANAPPNIVLIQADDQTLGQFTPGVMPNTKRLLADHGTSFRDYVATTAQCCPSRASLITGQYAHNDGVTSNGVGYGGLVDKSNVLPVWLQRAGYLTMHVGKFMNGYQTVTDPPSKVPPGWDQWYSFLGHTRYYDYDLYANGGVMHRGAEPEANATRVATNKAVQLIGSYASEALPFYLQLDEPAPHIGTQNDPYGDCSHAPIPERRDEHAFAGAPLPRPPSFNEADMSDKPPFLSSAPKLGPASVSQVRRRWRCALASLRGVDRAVAQVYRAVKRTGQLSRTVFIYISDNGQFYGEHRIEKGKVLPYDEAIHLPLVIKAPKRYLNGAARVKKVRRPVANIDIAPTILSLAHADPCPASGPCRTMDGRSLMPLMTRSGAWPNHRAVLTEYRAQRPGRFATCQFGGIITRGALYVEHSRVFDPGPGQCVPADQVERYDLGSDPFELHNLCFAGDPAKCPTDAAQATLESRLARLHDCAGIEGRDARVDGRPFCE